MGARKIRGLKLKASEVPSESMYVAVLTFHDLARQCFKEQKLPRPLITVCRIQRMSNSKQTGCKTGAELSNLLGNPDVAVRHVVAVCTDTAKQWYHSNSHSALDFSSQVDVETDGLGHLNVSMHI